MLPAMLFYKLIFIFESYRIEIQDDIVALMHCTLHFVCNESYHILIKNAIH